ncbi:MAG TPA: S41 family peptidase [Lachnospiraceae bacterium]|nr:S41 family peptidase [Lachnospiraceae bacterium]
MKKKKKRIWIPILVILALLIGSGLILINKYGARFNIYLFPPSTEAYVKNALVLMDNGIYASGSEWEQEKDNAIKAAKDCNKYEETYVILNKALEVAGGKHSCIVSNEASNTMPSEELPTTDFNDGILYVKLPAYTFGSGLGEKYTNIVLSGTKQCKSELEGVIIDLRDNTGGDMGPMIAAVSPFLPDGVLMQFHVGDYYSAVTLSNGTVRGGGSTITVEDIDILNVPIGILQNEWTASSGEATLLCFVELENVKTFGCGSAGYCSCNDVYTLYDGDLLQLTVGTDVTSSGAEYCEDPILPDVETENPEDDARAWIKGIE